MSAMDSRQETVLFNKALFYLRFRGRTISEMRQYLAKKAHQFGFQNAPIESVCKRLIDLKYLDDELFAESFIRSRSVIKPKGDYVIRQELLKKGIPTGIITKYLSENSVSELDRAQELLSRKKSSFSHTKKEKLHYKIISFLQRRGFSYDVAQQAYQAHMEEAMRISPQSDSS